ncbi:hypothetical protein [Paenibacillus alginolyticus]|nr:hypothetical protein [Paenibacillus alginolyticus]MEC0147066.1 hypothetical protein [Paenibacillus alginolyticus]
MVEEVAIWQIRHEMDGWGLRLGDFFMRKKDRTAKAVAIFF